MFGLFNYGVTSRLRGKFCGSGKNEPVFRDAVVTCCLACFRIYGGAAGKFNAKRLRDYRQRLAGETDSAMDVDVPEANIDEGPRAEMGGTQRDLD